MNLIRLRTLGQRRRAAEGRSEAAYRILVDAVLEELERAGGDADVQAAAEAAGISRGTVYRELARRQTTRDELTSNGAPAPAPHDADDVDVPVTRRNERTPTP